ncbi:hypothetical protein Tco_1023496 [Tanacetum coccineum]
MAVHNIKQREAESTRDFATRYTDDTLQILGLPEDRRISGFVHRLRTRNLVEFLSTNLPTTFKGLIEKTYTWIKVREVATNGTLNDRRESFERSKKTSWDNNRGQKRRDRFSPYRGPNRGLLSKLSKSPREILATEKIEEAIKLGQLSHLVKGIKKERAKASDTQREEGRRTRALEITFLPVIRNNNSSALVIIKARIFGRQVNRVYMDSGSSCEVIYEHCFLKLKPSIKASKVNSKVPLVEFLGEHTWPIGEVPLEITIVILRQSSKRGMAWAPITAWLPASGGTPEGRNITKSQKSDIGSQPSHGEEN